MSTFSYRHLYYFWVVAHENGIGRAASRLGMAVQTISAQVHQLERDLGHALLKPAGRGVTLTDAGLVVMRQADLIFELGEALPALVRGAGQSPVRRLTVGVSEGLAKLVVHHFMEPLRSEHAHLVFREDDFDELLASLALHRLDVILADRAAPPNPNLKLYSHALESSDVAWYAAPTLRADARRDFPRCLARVPVLLPTAQAALRSRIDLWFDRHGIRPRIAGEFDDSALMKTFGAHGVGVFPVASLVHDEVVKRYGVQRVGLCEGVGDAWFAIGTERKVQHPLVARLLRRAP